MAPYRFGHGTLDTSDRIVVRLETDDGIEGWGELNPILSPESTKSVIENDIAEAVVGRDVWEVEAVLDEFSWVDPYMANNPALGAVEMAMWDAYGKRLGEPVHRLLGGKCREEVPFAFCLGILDPERSRAKAREIREMGFTSIKTKGGRDWRQDVERIAAIHDEVGDEVDIRIDPNQNWSVEETVRAVSSLEDAGVRLEYIEQPIDVDKPGALKQLRSRLRTPIGANEDMYVPHNLSTLTDADAIDVGVVDMIPAGGLLALKKMAAIAEEKAVSLTHHNSFDFGIKTAAILHVVASTPAYDLPPDTTYYALTDRFIDDPFEFDDGALPVPDEPGLGVTVDREAVERNEVSL
ncbi:mandelate racemase/muconate lactonizing enzyme family protein [Haloarculaceae archaeon H-GB2-1]|nr:mandelate racemase/muconate lactonizing enzyme family protein [Haloarculaceae archaeon H-GB11]MEA5408335.1 mandelate racemase/muconate lactonizing enzyme family protein [Haloarculaceae archaeon H-GB2-1]